MANKYIELAAGLFAQVEALVTSAGAGDAGKIVALDGTGKLDNSLLPTGVGAETKIMTTSENLSAGNFVNVYDNGGTVTARKSDASNGFPANGFVLASTTSGANATVYLAGINNQVSGLTGGDLLFTSATAGAATDTAPSTAGYIVQQIGYAISTTEVAFNPQPTVTLV
jgi:hypothetical protein